MRKLKNPWLGIDGYNCFGCAPHNPYGLKMEFYVDGHCAVSVDITGEYFKDFHQPMYIILSHDFRTNMPGADETENPSYDIFQYIRLYQDDNGVLQDKRKGDIVL